MHVAFAIVHQMDTPPTPSLLPTCPPPPPNPTPLFFLFLQVMATLQSALADPHGTSAQARAAYRVMMGYILGLSDESLAQNLSTIVVGVPVAGEQDGSAHFLQNPNADDAATVNEVFVVAEACLERERPGRQRLRFSGA